MGANVEYKVLYRSFRPNTFESVIGQRHITDILKSQVAHETIAHAYLFCGPRGTGKTSTAKIFARAACCSTPVDGDSCGKCEICLNPDVEDVDIIEIDAASNNGVEEIRNLREKVRLSPVYGLRKVYIIDEVHMLSQGAFNALLKTLEEPPLHVIFILATTEPHKLPSTIISRCQRFDFHRVSIDDITSRLEFICDQLNVEYDRDALFIIARKAEGGFRDALSFLDQCMANGLKINAQNVLTVLGDVPFDTVHSFAKAIIKGDADSLLSNIEDIINSGLDLEIFLSDIIAHVRNMLIARMVKNPEIAIKEQGANLKSIISLANETNENRLIRTIDALVSAQSSMKYASSPRIILEAAVLKAAMPETQTDVLALLDRIDALESQLDEIKQSGITIANEHKPQKENKIAIPEKEEKRVATKKCIESEQAPEKAEQSSKPIKQTGNGSGKTNWQKILEHIEKEDIVLYTTASEGKFVKDDNNVLTIAVDDDIFISALKSEARFNQLKLTVKKVCGYDNIDIIKTSDMNTKVEQKSDILELAFGMFGKENVDIIDD